METCPSRTAYFLARPEHRAANALPDGPLPHVYGSRQRQLVDGVWRDWTPPKCSWCGKPQP